MDRPKTPLEAGLREWIIALSLMRPDWRKEVKDDPVCSGSVCSDLFVCWLVFSGVIGAFGPYAARIEGFFLRRGGGWAEG